MKKIAILHDYFDEIGGAEITLLYMARTLNATIYTTNIDKEKVIEIGFEDVLPRMYSIGRVSGIKFVKQLFTQIRFRFVKIEGFDEFIIGGIHSIYSSKNNTPNLWYCFSPDKGLYNQKASKNILLKLLKKIQKERDRRTVKNINRIIAPSINVSNRISNIYNFSVKHIYSPINTLEFYWKKHDNYWLSVTRIDPYKRLEIQIEAFKKLPRENLVIIGSTSKENIKYLKKLKTLASPNIIFYDSIYDRTKLVEFYAFSKGFICSAMEEDFGMTVVEAMSAGKPVLAPNEGGYKETIINKKTGELIDEFDSFNLSKTIKGYSKILDKNPELFKIACQKRAEEFDLKKFESEIRSLFI